MSRIRTIKPEILDDEKAARLSDRAWRLWVSTWIVADDHGRFHAHPRRLHSLIFWAREDLSNPREDLASTREALDELNIVGLIRLYRVNEEIYAEIPGWKSHQKIDRPSKPRFPSPEEGEIVSPETTLASPREDVSSPRDRPPTSDLDQEILTSAPRAREDANWVRTFEPLKDDWNRRGLEQIPLLDHAERNAYYANFFLPRQKAGLTEEQILADALLLPAKVEASSIYKQRSLRGILSKPDDLEKIMSGDRKDWSRVERPRPSPEDVLSAPLSGGGAGLRARLRALEELEARDGQVIETTATPVNRLGPGGGK